MRAAMLGQDSEALLTAARHQLSHATQGIRDDAQVAVEAHLLTGVPHRVVLDTAGRLGSRLIVAGARGRHPGW
jgi:nucleotide-binding universal stress UspA family protein